MQEETRIRVRDTDDASDVYAFLSDEPVAWSRLIAARAALRVLPALLRPFDAKSPQLWMVGFRACFIPWASGKFPAHDLDKALYSASRSAYTGTRSIYHWEDVVDRNALSAASSALASAEFAAGPSTGLIDQSVQRWDSKYNNNIKSTIARLAADGVARAAKAIVDPAHYAEYWLVVEKDLNWLIGQGNTVLTTSFSALPLWNYRPERRWVLDRWQEFISNKVAIDDGYGPWIDWYNGVQIGTDPFGPDLTLRIAQQPNEWWNRPPFEVNADIAEWVRQRDQERIEIPEPEPGISLGIAEDGRIGIVPMGVPSQEEQHQLEGLLEVLGEKADELAELLTGSNAFALLLKDVRKYADEVRRQTFSVDRLYARGNFLENTRAHLQKDIDAGNSPDMALEVAAGLDSVLAMHGPLIGLTNRGQLLLESSHLYESKAVDISANRLAARDFANAVARSDRLFTNEVREEWPVMADSIGTGRYPERSTQMAMVGNKNVLIALAILVAQPVLESAVTASIPGALAVGSLKGTIDAAWLFMISYLPAITNLVQVSGSSLAWMRPVLRLISQGRG